MSVVKQASTDFACVKIGAKALHFLDFTFRDIEVDVDGYRRSQVLANLLNNATGFRGFSTFAAINLGNSERVLYYVHQTNMDW